MPLNLKRKIKDPLAIDQDGATFKLLSLVNQYTRVNPNVAIASPLPFIRAVLNGDSEGVKAEPVNGCVEIAKSLINVIDQWIGAYNEDHSDPVGRVLSYWDVFKGFSANPLWGGDQGASANVMPVINASMMNYEAAVQSGDASLIKEAERMVYILTLGTLVDKFAGGGPAAMFIREARKELT